MSKVDPSKLFTWIKLTDDFYLDPDGILGKGAFGEVFRGYSAKKDAIIAIKTMEGEGYQRQVQTLKTLSSLNHSNIMGYYGFEKVGDSVYIFVEFCPNGTLTDYIKEGIDEAEVLKLFRQLIEGMCYMNAKGKMHRDLKPDNVLIGLDHDIKISDFGLARETSSIFVTGQMGTPLYAGPEVYLGKFQEGYTEKCDVWGAGMILYEMLTQKVLFDGVKTYDDLKKEWQSYEISQRRVEYGPKFHPNWQFFTNLMLTYDPKKRPTFHQILERIKKAYPTMMEQIKNKQNYTVNDSTPIGRLELLLIFFRQKYNILIRVFDKLTQHVLPIKSQFKLLIQFLCICHYLCKIKKIIRNLKYKRIKVNQNDKNEMIQEDNQQYDLLLEKYKNFFDQKYNFHNNQLEQQIVPKLLELRDKKTEIAVELKDMFELVSDVNDGAFDVQETYSECLQTLISTHIEKFQPKAFDSMKPEELRTIILVFLAAMIQTKVENKNYLNKNYIKDLTSSSQKKLKEMLLIQIRNFQKELK